MTICTHYVVGVDIGQSMQPTAVAVVEQKTQSTRRDTWDWKTVEMSLRHLERFPLDAGYPAIGARLDDLIGHLHDKEQDSQTDLIIDITGSGRAGANYMRRFHGVAPITVTIKGGSGETEVEPGDWCVAKTELIGHLMVAYQTSTLKVAKSLDLAATLSRELADFKMKPPTLNPNDPEAWREGQHDDLVFAVALTTWRISKHVPTVAEAPDRYSRRRVSPDRSWITA
jgi:hypothetical protein